VPITGQTFAVCLVGASLGAVRGATSLALYFLIGCSCAGLRPSRPRLETITSASGGYIVGFCRRGGGHGTHLAEHRWDRRSPQRSARC
jgi:biotin transport system substrate-specific component